MALFPACAETCYNGGQPSYGCNFVDTACYCKQSVATQLVRCVQGKCDQTDLQSYIGWAQQACADVGVSFDASASSVIATSGSDSSLMASIGSSRGTSTTFSSLAADSMQGAAAAGTTMNEGSTSTTAQSQGTLSPITSSQTSVDAPSQTTVTSADNGSASSGGLNTSDKIAIGIGLPVGLATILGVWITWKLYKRGKTKRTN